MRHEIDRFAHLASPVHRWDARWKLAAGAVFILAFAAVQKVLLCAGLGLTMVVALLLASRLPVRWILARLRGVLLVLAFLAVVIPLSGPAPYRLVAGVSLSSPGLHLAALLVLKVFAIVLLVMILFATASIQQTTVALQRLRLPPMLVQLVHFTYRYIFVFADESARMRWALAARGERRRFTRRTLRTLGHFVGNLLVRSFERADRVQYALAARGYDGTVRTLTSLNTRPADVLKFAALAGAGVGLAALEFTLR